MKPVLISVAINEEFKVVKKLLANAKIFTKDKVKIASGSIGEIPVEMFMTNMGLQAAQTSSVQMINAEKYSAVIIFGYCGGLSHTLGVGDALIATRVLSKHEKNIFEMDSQLSEALGKCLIQMGVKYRAAPMLTQDTVAETRREKQKLYEQTKAEAVDMETYEVVKVAKQKILPVLALKVVIDDDETELPHFNDYFEKSGQRDHLTIAKVLMKEPGKALQLSKNMKQAALILNKIIPTVLQRTVRQWKLNS